MKSQYDTLLERVGEIHDLQKASQLLAWDRQVIMPKAGAAVRVQQMTTLDRLVHDLFTRDEMGELIERAAEECEGLPYESIESSLIRLLRRQYDDARKLPDEHVARVSETSGKAHGVWEEARENDDFASYQPWLEQIVELGQERAELFGYERERYDALLDKYERNAKTEDVRNLFSATRQALVPLLEAIRSTQVTVDDSFLYQSFPIPQQKEFARYIARAIGYEFDRGYLGTAVHPFAASFSRDDVRITGRWNPDYLSPSIFATLHEAGHAIYEQNTHPDLARTPLARGASAGIHESQSRMMENMVGRSLSFWNRHFPNLQSLFPQQLGNVDVGAFYLAINKVQPSLIRVEADELTYNLHIILRFEIEQALIDGDLSVSDLPEAWNEKMREMIGIVPRTDRDGVLQDVHWTWPSFGYFPTYALGNLYAAQFYAAATADSPTVSAELESGKNGALLQWLRTNVHEHGRKFTPDELVEQATGQRLDHRPFISYVTAKFAEIYGY